jgi:hypothetical protein
MIFGSLQAVAVKFVCKGKYSNKLKGTKTLPKVKSSQALHSATLTAFLLRWFDNESEEDKCVSRM